MEADRVAPRIVCLSCFGRSRSILQPCARCGSRRLAHVLFLIQQFGREWKALMEADKGAVH